MFLSHAIAVLSTSPGFQPAASMTTTHCETPASASAFVYSFSHVLYVYR